jgi:uncharacterized protein YuzE
VKISYYPETDTFYIELKELPSVESEEIAEGIVVDYAENGEVVGIEIEHISKRKNVELPFVGKLLLTPA